MSDQFLIPNLVANFDGKKFQQKQKFGGLQIKKKFGVWQNHLNFVDTKVNKFKSDFPFNI